MTSNFRYVQGKFLEATHGAAEHTNMMFAVITEGRTKFFLMTDGKVQK